MFTAHSPSSALTGPPGSVAAPSAGTQDAFRAPMSGQYQGCSGGAQCSTAVRAFRPRVATAKAASLAAATPSHHCKPATRVGAIACRPDRWGLLVGSPCQAPCDPLEHHVSMRCLVSDGNIAPQGAARARAPRPDWRVWAAGRPVPWGRTGCGTASAGTPLPRGSHLSLPAAGRQDTGGLIVTLPTAHTLTPPREEEKEPGDKPPPVLTPPLGPFFPLSDPASAPSVASDHRPDGLFLDPADGLFAESADGLFVESADGPFVDADLCIESGFVILSAGGAAHGGAPDVPADFTAECRAARSFGGGVESDRGGDGGSGLGCSSVQAGADALPSVAPPTSLPHSARARAALLSPSSAFGFGCRRVSGCHKQVVPHRGSCLRVDVSHPFQLVGCRIKTVDEQGAHVHRCRMPHPHRHISPHPPAGPAPHTHLPRAHAPFVTPRGLFFFARAPPQPNSVHFPPRPRRCTPSARLCPFPAPGRDWFGN